MIATLMLSRMRRWYRTHEAIRRLGELDDRALKDLGITRGEIPSAVSGLPRERSTPFSLS
jgi:uncharacterized protein YjiS (DUF1127 family)